MEFGFVHKNIRDDWRLAVDTCDVFGRSVQAVCLSSKVVAYSIA